MQFIIAETDDVLVSHSGLALVGTLLQRTALRRRLDALDVPARHRPTLSHGEVLLSMVGLLCLGKSDYADIEAFRGEAFFPRALGLSRLPSEETLRQRLDQIAAAPAGGPAAVEALHEESADMVRRHAPRLVPCHEALAPLDVDVSPWDNSDSKKEGLGWTYKQFDGFAPAFAYLGQEGYLLHAELRPGNQHCQNGTPEFLVRAIALARRATKAPLLVRMDAGNDDGDNLRILRKSGVDWIIKRNLRRESHDEWLEIAQAHGTAEEPREGQVIWTGETTLDRDDRSQRVVFRVVEETIDKDGQLLLLPKVEIATWWTSLPRRRATPEQVIALYCEHGTSEQFHAELKGELDLERLPSGKFATNGLMLSLGLVAYNALRLCGQAALAANKRLSQAQQAPLSKKVQRRRLRSVILDLMYHAARLTEHARRFTLALWNGNPWRFTWQRLYQRFTPRRHPANARSP